MCMLQSISPPLYVSVETVWPSLTVKHKVRDKVGTRMTKVLNEWNKETSQVGPICGTGSEMTYSYS